jgi:hypothetical protein
VDTLESVALKIRCAEEGTGLVGEIMWTDSAKDVQFAVRFIEENRQNKAN